VQWCAKAWIRRELGHQRGARDKESCCEHEHHGEARIGEGESFHVEKR